MTSTDESNILIVGGGLAGLALATYLRRQGREPLLVEQASDWRGSGDGIGLWSDGLAVRDELGRPDTAREHAADPDGFEIRASDGDLLTRTTLPPEQTLLLAIHRADLHAALRADVPTDWIKMGTSPTRTDEDPDEVVVTIDDGATGTFDLVVGADGIHSTVRKQCFTEWTKREYDTIPERARDCSST